MKLSFRPVWAMLMLCPVFSQGAPLNQAVSDTPIKFFQSEAPFRYDFGEDQHRSFVQFYGIIDLTRARTNHTLPANYQLSNNFYPYAGTRVTNGVSTRTQWINGGLQDSRFGLRGEMGLFNIHLIPFKFVYVLEGGFNPMDGSLNNAAQTLADNSGTNANHNVSADNSLNGDLFARQAWAGVEAGKYGRFSYGNQYNLFFDIFAAYDPNNKADTFSPFGESGAVGGGGGISENARMPHALKYMNTLAVLQSGTLHTGIMYQYGNAESTAHGEGMAAQLGFENNRFGVQLAWNKFSNAIRAASAGPGNPLANNTITGALFNTEATLLTLRWFPRTDVRLSGGWEWYQLRPSTDSTLRYSQLFDQTLFGGTIRSGLDKGYRQNVNVYFAGARYEFAERFPRLSGLSVSVGYYDTRFDAIQGPTVSTNSQGDIRTYTSIVDYVFNRRFDTYLAYTTNHFSGDRFPSATFYRDVSTLGAGLRLRF